MISRVVLAPKARRSRIVWGGASLLVVAASLLVIARGGFAQLKAPSADDRQVTNAVTTMLSRRHVTGHPLDNEISERWLKTFLKMLDPMKMYFMQNDIDEFNMHKDELDDLALKGDISFAYRIFSRYVNRIDEKVKMIDELLKVKPDFTIDEELVTDPDKRTYAHDDKESRENWRKQLKYDLLLLNNEKDEKGKDEKTKGDDKAVDKPEEPKLSPEEKFREAVDKRSHHYHSVAKWMKQTTNDELLEMYLTALCESYDPHSSYMSKSTLEDFNIQMRLRLEGIGAALQFKDGYTTVDQIIPGGPADKDGRLKPKDRVVGVGQGANGEIEDVVDMRLRDVVKKIRGDKNTIVRLAVIPAGKSSREIYNITRAEVEIKDSEARSIIFEAGTKPDGKPYKIGAIELPSFYMDMNAFSKGDPNFKSTTRDVEVLLRKFREEHVDAVIMDLRRNGGGSLPEAVNLTGLFIESGPVVQIKSANGAIEQDRDPDPSVAWSGPFVVLTSKFSASASEIFAGAIQDYQRGLVVGDHSTHGKGTVQSLRELGEEIFHISNANAPQLGAIKITVSKFYRPSGDSTQNRGVLADVEIPSISSQSDTGESTLDYALKFDQVSPSTYAHLGQVNSAMVTQLAKNSADRIKDSGEFAKLKRNMARFHEQRERKRVTLNEQKFLAQRAEFDADKEEDDELQQLSATNRPVEKRDYYFEEVMAIAIDYLRMLQSPQNAGIGQANAPVKVGG